MVLSSRSPTHYDNYQHYSFHAINMTITSLLYRCHTTMQRCKQCQSILSTMPDCCSWLSRVCCCRRQTQPNYIYLYSPRMVETSSSSPSPALFRCLVCLILGFCVAFILIVTGVIIYHLNSNTFSLKSSFDQQIIPIAKKRQLPDFVNLDINPCEHFYEFVCDKWTQRNRLERYGEEYEQKWTRIRYRIHDTLMANISNSPSISSDERNFSSPTLSVYKLYQLCERQSPSLLIDEFERYFALFIEQEPYRSHLTIYNQTNPIDLTSLPIDFLQNPFFQVFSSSDHNNQAYFTIVRIYPRPLPSPLMIFPNSTTLNQTALTNLIKFNNDYTTFLQEANDAIKLYEQEYNEDSLIIKRILSYSDYHICLSSLNGNNGLHNLIQLLNYFLQYRLRQFNTKLMDKQIRMLENIINNHTLVEQLRRVRLEFKTIEQIVPTENRAADKNTTCIINLLDQLLDERFKLDELPSSINLYLQNATEEYFTSNDWPYLMMLYERLLKKTPTDTLVNFVFFDYYRQLIYPYYQPHIHRSIEFENSNSSCRIESCFDVLNCYHPSLLNQIIEADNQIPVDSIKLTVQNIINRFRSLIEQSDNLFSKEKNLLINELIQIKILVGHYSPSFTPIPHLNSSSYLEHVQSFSSLPYDQQEHSYSIEPIYSPFNHTLFLPYGFLYLTNNSIEYSLMNFLLKLLSQTIQSNPFYIECLIKSFDDTNTTMIDITDEHIVYLLFRSKFLSEENIILDGYLWPFMSANSLMKTFLINYTADNYCPTAQTYELYLNNTYLIDDVHLVFHCQQASSIKQSKCTVN